MTRLTYEFRVVCWSGPMTKSELDEMGKAGWRLVTVVQNYERLLHYFERPLPDPSISVGSAAAPAAHAGGPT